MSGWSRTPGGGLREPKLNRAKVELTKRELAAFLMAYSLLYINSLCLFTTCALLIRELTVSYHILS